ncbi:MAG: deoxyribose-phosphate aldolase [Planctomycetia bacterium]|nr:deoxyribose-phosphate aldolase [Planctomycetia bacterium]
MTENFTSVLDYAVLKPENTLADLEKAVEICKCYKVGNLCVRPCDVSDAVRLLDNCGTSVSAVVAFPHGDSCSDTKTFEAKRAFEDGAVEVDMVLNIGKLKSGEDEFVQADIAAVVKVARLHRGIVKVIFETSLLTTDEICRAVRISIAAGAAFVKTSTGFSSGGATLDVVRLMVKESAGRIKVKASGGIRSRFAAEEFLAAGAERLGVGNVETLLNDEEKA